MDLRFKMLPKCNPQEDYLELNQLECNSNGEGIVGTFYNKDNSIKINIFLSDYALDQTRHKNIYFSIDEKNYLTKSVIVINNDFYKKLMEDNSLWSLIWHEMGHFHTLPYILGDTSTLSYLELRKTTTMSGDVMPEEKLGDLFAAFMNGKDKTINAIKWLRDTRKKEVENPAIDYAIKEYNNRIHFLKELDENTAMDLYNKILEENKLR